MKYRQIKKIARENGLKTTDLIALARKNDPFYFGTEGDWEKARWAREYWERMGSPMNVHPRRIHYYIVSLDDPTRYDGKAYKNVETDWKHLTECLKAARYLGEIPFEAITDARNPKVALHHSPMSDSNYTPQPVQLTSDLRIERPYFYLDSIEELIDRKVDSLVESQLEGSYYSSEGRQPYLCEVWVEKTTMTDVLDPVTRRYAANLQEGKGESSIRMALNLVNRVRNLKRKGFMKPVRIFYISDFDPHGRNMPKSMARHLEFFIRESVGFDMDVKVKALALTEGQCREYELPRTPVSDERMLGKWETRYGEGRTELDALEAQQPGLLEQIVEEALEEYYDSEMDKKVRHAEQNLKSEIEDAITEEIEKKREDMEKARKKLQPKLREAREFIEKWEEENRELIKEYKNLFDIDPDLDGIELVEPDADVYPNEHGFFFDSKLSYFDQLREYKERW